MRVIIDEKVDQGTRFPVVLSGWVRFGVQKLWCHIHVTEPGVAYIIEPDAEENLPVFIGELPVQEFEFKANKSDRINRNVEETDGQFEKRQSDIEVQAKWDKQLRKKTYLKLKQEFENPSN